MEKDVIVRVSTEGLPSRAETDLEENENVRQRETGILDHGAHAITVTLKSGEHFLKKILLGIIITRVARTIDKG